MLNEDVFKMDVTNDYVITSIKKKISTIYVANVSFSGLMVGALVPGASGPGSSPGRARCVVFLGKTLTMPLSTQEFSTGRRIAVSFLAMYVFSIWP